MRDLDTLSSAAVDSGASRGPDGPALNRLAAPGANPNTEGRVPMYSAVIEEYLAPTTLEDALAALARHRRDARIIAGGHVPHAAHEGAGGTGWRPRESVWSTQALLFLTSTGFARPVFP